MRVIGKILAFVVAAVFVLTLPLTLILYNGGQYLFTPAKMEAALLDLLVEGDLLPAALQTYASEALNIHPDEAQAELARNALATLTLEDWRALRDILLPERILSPWVHAIVEGVFTWLEGDAPTPKITLEMGEIKKHLAGAGGKQLIAYTLEALPPCTPDMLKALLSGEVVICRPQESSDIPLDEIASSYMENAVAAIPDTLVLDQNLFGGAAGLALSSIKLQFNLARTVIRWGPYLGVVLLLLIAALAVRSGRELGRWWGIPLILGGGLTALAGSLISRLPSLLAGISPPAGMPAALGKALPQVMAYLGAKALQPLLLQGGVILGIGLLLLVIMSLFKSPKTEASLQLTQQR
ncbi:MAG: hypothetical protein D6803_00160 [Anaerolineae bacterium]|nr:MAG: hypothetical protein D6803_00160 [Anaerolineae bacterium]